MPRIEHSFHFLLLLFCCFVSMSCAAGETAAIGDTGAGLAPCPTSPNCVSSEAQDADHHVEPLRFAVAAKDAWRILKEQLAKQARTIIVTEKPGYLHAQSKSAVFGFVDDLEFYLRPGQGVIAVRFAARTGYYDFGVNRQRVEDLRAAFLQAGAAP